MNINYIKYLLYFQIRQRESSNFKNTLNLLDKLTTDTVQDTPVIYHKPPLKTANLVMKTITKTMGTQTLTQPPVKVLQKPPTAMKIRMASLNQQVAVLTKAKHKHSKVSI